MVQKVFSPCIRSAFSVLSVYQSVKLLKSSLRDLRNETWNTLRINVDFRGSFDLSLILFFFNLVNDGNAFCQFAHQFSWDTLIHLRHLQPQMDKRIHNTVLSIQKSAWHKNWMVTCTIWHTSTTQKLDSYFDGMSI